VNWTEGAIGPVALTALGQRYRRYRLADPPAEEAMAGSLRRWGQLSPVVACAHGQQLELLDGFKRLAAAQQVAGWSTLSVRRVDVDERMAKAAILGLNRGQRPVREPEEAWIVQALVRDDGLMEAIGPAQELGVPATGAVGEAGRGGTAGFTQGLVSARTARALVSLPAGKQSQLLRSIRAEGLSSEEVRGVVALLHGSLHTRAGGLRAGPTAAGAGGGEPAHLSGVGPAVECGGESLQQATGAAT
jgi:hypothetical protein